MKLAKAENVLFIFNLLGACIFLWVASKTWIHPELANLPGASGGNAISWFFTAVPILLVFLVVNIISTGWAAMNWIRVKIWPLTNISFLSLLIWLLVIIIDNSRHGT